MFELKIRNAEDASVTADLVRDVSYHHPPWVHHQLGTESESELQAVLDGCEQGEYLRNPGQADDAGIFFDGETFTISAYFERDDQIIDASQAEVIGEAYGQIYTHQSSAEDAADALQADLDGTDLDPSTTYVVKAADGRTVYSAR